MKKRIASLFVAAVMVLGICPVASFASTKQIWIGGKQVTAKNAEDVFGDGSVSYDRTTETLTLNNARISEGSVIDEINYGIYTDGNLNIVLNGNSSIYLDDEDKTQNGIKAGGNITVSGGGELRVRARGASSKGVFTEGTLFVEHGSMLFAAGIDKKKAPDSGAVWSKKGILLDEDVFECYEYSRIIEYIDEETEELYYVFSYDGETPVSRVMLDDVDEYYAEGENPDDKVTMYKVIVLNSENGSVNVLGMPFGGGNVRVEIKPGYGYKLNSFEIKDDTFRPVAVKDKGEGVYDFVMPYGNVYVSAEFVKDGKGEKELPFTDVNENEWYGKAVRYVYENGLIAEELADKFYPGKEATRAMIVSMLWMAEGMPWAEDAGFTDIKDGTYYKKAVDWAKSTGVSVGYGSTFGPDDSVTREQMVSMLYRYAVLKGIDVSAGENTNILSYDDAFSISEYAFPAMQWACASDIISGYGASLFPQGTATRAQLSQVMMMFLN